MNSVTFIQYNLGDVSSFEDSVKIMADVYFLQEVNDINRPEIALLEENNYKILESRDSSDRFADAALAISQTAFEDIKRVIIHMEERELISAAFAIHKATRKKCLLISGHAPGFSFHHEGEALFLSARIHHEYMSSIIEQIDETVVDLIIGGMDMNNTPEKYRDSFELMEDKRFRWLRTGEPTQSTLSDINPERETDYFFVRTAKWNWIECLTPTVLGCREFTKDKIDHLPIQLTITIDNGAAANISGKVSTFARSLSRRLTL